MPDDVPVDIRAKLMVCLIHQNIFKPLNVSSRLIWTYYFMLTEMMRFDTV